MSSSNQPELPNETTGCKSCKHSVDVRGIEQVVCLAYLATRHPTKDGICSEYEGKIGKAVVSSGG